MRAASCLLLARPWSTIFRCERIGSPPLSLGYEDARRRDGRDASQIRLQVLIYAWWCADRRGDCVCSKSACDRWSWHGISISFRSCWLWRGNCLHYSFDLRFGRPLSAALPTEEGILDKCGSTFADLESYLGLGFRSCSLRRWCCKCWRSIIGWDFIGGCGCSSLLRFYRLSVCLCPCSISIGPIVLFCFFILRGFFCFRLSYLRRSGLVLLGLPSLCRHYLFILLFLRLCGL
mmetsp:Transcript_15606/g.35844  ORF Transcript_15606/g.35844 Transcript_15606/m.35844 type:complete len:233 (-) Transcript_15606:1900-2598(-)